MAHTTAMGTSSHNRRAPISPRAYWVAHQNDSGMPMVLATNGRARKCPEAAQAAARVTINAIAGQPPAATCVR